MAERCWCRVRAVPCRTRPGRWRRVRWPRSVSCSPRGACWSRCLSVSSWASAMIPARRSIVQLRLELAESPAPAAALWELVGEQQRQTAMTLLAAMIAQTVAPEVSDDGVPVAGAGTAGRDECQPRRRRVAAAGDGVLER